MQTTLDNKKKVAADSPRSALKRNNRVEEVGALGLGVKREQESTDSKAQKMMKGKMEPFAMPIMVRVMKQTAKIPQMTTPHETQLREQKQEVPHMTFPHRKNS